VAEPLPRTAALLLNWRRADLTAQCLQDLLAVDDVPLAVLVIDNGSGPADLAALRSAVAAAAARGTPHTVELAALPENRGFTGGMNHGLAWAAAQRLPFVLVLNNDLRLPPDFLRPLVATLQHDPRVAAVGPTVLSPDGTVWAEGGRRGFVPNGLVLRRRGRPPTPREHGPEAVGFLPGACVLFRTDAVAAVGGFEDAYFMYWEDVDLCERLRARGGRIVWLPWVRVTHQGGQSAGGSRSPARKFLMACNAVRFLRARGSPGAWCAWFCCDVLGWPLSLLGGVRSAWAKLRGTWAGLRGHRASAADVAQFVDAP
jgi:GT2 family glycosyltransferase